MGKRLEKLKYQNKKPLEVEKSYTKIEYSGKTAYGYLDDLTTDFSSQWEITKKIKNEDHFTIHHIYPAPITHETAQFVLVISSVDKGEEKDMEELLSKLDAALGIRYGATYFELRNSYLTYEKGVSDKQKKRGEVRENDSQGSV